ncbi:MAG: response regulator transcription factor [Methylococcales bacterium]|nr:response regulator transcription factor [Methylococcales bacterium]
MNKLTIQIITPIPVDFSHKMNGTVIGEFDNSVNALKFAEESNPHIILLDYDIEQGNTPLYIQTILIESPKSKIVLLGKDLPNDIVLNSLMAGGLGYIDYSNIDEFLDKAVQVIGKGEAWVSRRLVCLLLQKIRD